MAKYVLLKNKTTNERSVRITGGQIVTEKDQPEEYKRLRKLATKNLNQAAKNDAYRSCGLKKVRGNLGGTYWE